MLCNNADARRCSYFELGLSVIKCKRNNNDANSKIFPLNVKLGRWKISGWLLCSFAYLCLKLKPILTYLTPCLKPDVAVFDFGTFDCVRLAQGVIFGRVRLSSITELNRSPNRTTGVLLGSTTELSISRPGNRYQNVK